jgi:hypothetical protein
MTTTMPFPAGMCALHDFNGSRDRAAPQDRLREVRRRVEGLRERMLDEPEVLCWRSFDLIRAPYPTYYAFSGVFADSGFKFPLVHLLNRLFVVQYLDHEGMLRTLLMSPTDHDANRQTPFYKRLAERAPTWVQPIVAPQFNTVESVLQTCGLRPEDIDYISYDHLHMQDVRHWLAGPKPHLPKAQLLVHKQEWASTLSLLPIQAEWYCPQGIAGIPAERVVTVEGSLSLGPGVALIHTPGHTEGSNDQYISMVLEKTLAGPSANPEFPNCATSSERTPCWLFPGDRASHLFGEAHFGRIHARDAQTAQAKAA